MMPACDHTGVPLHFHSSSTSGSAALMSARMRRSVSPRQSPSSSILWSISTDADGVVFAASFVMCRPPCDPSTIPDNDDTFDSPSCRWRSEEHTSELQSLMRISYAVLCLKKKKRKSSNTYRTL